MFSAKFKIQIYFMIKSHSCSIPAIFYLITPAWPRQSGESQKKQRQLISLITHCRLLKSSRSSTSTSFKHITYWFDDQATYHPQKSVLFHFQSSCSITDILLFHFTQLFTRWPRPFKSDTTTVLKFSRISVLQKPSLYVILRFIIKRGNYHYVTNIITIPINPSAFI